MAWSFVRPVDQSVLAGRPLLDIGVGDGQTLLSLVGDEGLIVGLDRSPVVIRVTRVPLVVGGDALALPFAGGVFGSVLAADVFHHLDDERLVVALREIRRVLRRDGQLVAWWYAEAGITAPDAPRFPREDVTEACTAAGFGTVEPLELTVESGPRTVGIAARI